MHAQFPLHFTVCERRRRDVHPLGAELLKPALARMSMRGFGRPRRESADEVCFVGGHATTRTRRAEIRERDLRVPWCQSC